MVLIVLGLVLWAGVHLVPTLAPALKANWQRRLGYHGYRGSFALLIALGLALMIAGWRQALPTYLYTLPPIADLATFGIMLLACVLFVASKLPTRIKSLIKHPQLTAVVLWGLAHLLSNGDSRSAVLFGGLTIWALVEIILISLRDGPAKPAPVKGMAFEIVPLALGLALYVALILTHPYLSGIGLG